MTAAGSFMLPRIISIAYTPAAVEQRPEDRYARVPAEKVMLVEGHGVLGDTKGRRGRRQLNVMLAETVAQLQVEGFQTAPGELGEQIVVAGLEPDRLVPGIRLYLGETAVIEITLPRTPCGRFAHIQGKPKEAALEKIGFMARVLQGGEIMIGSVVSIAQSSEVMQAK